MIDTIINNWGKIVSGIMTTGAAGIAVVKYTKDYIKRKNEKEEADKKEHTEIKLTLKDIQDRLDIIVKFIDEERTKKEFRNKLEIESFRIISAQTALDDPMKTLLHAGLECTINLAQQLYSTEVELTREYISDKANAIFNNLKIICNTYFPESKVMRGKEITFARFLREYTNIANYSFEYINKIMEIKKNMYNGDMKYNMIKCYTEFLRVMYEEGISAYMEFKHGIKK